MLYFSEQPHSPRRDELEQWGKVLDFKEEFQNAGLLWSYPGPEGFEALLRQHATKFVLDFCKRDTPGAARTPDATVRAADAEADTLLRVLTAAARQGAGVLPAERVNELGAGLGLEAGAVLGTVERLRRAGAIELHWGGGVSVSAPGRGPKE